MREPSSKPRIRFEPPFNKRGGAWRKCRQYAAELSAVEPSDFVSIERIRKSALEDAAKRDEDERYLLGVVFCFMCDLRMHGWDFVCGGACIDLIPSIPDGKEAVRQAHFRGREIQLTTSSVRDFVRSMERRREWNSEWVSIFSLIRDGREFAESLKETSSGYSESGDTQAFRQSIDPYLEFVTDGARCAHTGLKLMDVWRYFRHTWTNTYTTVPGRTLHVLVRDRSVPFHPVIGIAALASPVIQLSRRDEWIGWTSKEFIQQLRDNASAAWAKWVHRSLDDLLDEVFHKDFVREKILSRKDLKSPSTRTIECLRKLAESERELHQKFPDRRTHKNPTNALDDEAWKARSATHLFRWKRAGALADLLNARMQLRESGWHGTTAKEMRRAMGQTSVQKAIDTIRRYTKAKFVGNNILDITVCGAIAPYNEVLGGKLVAMLLTSPEVCDEYARKYGKTASIIASSMAGRAVHRRPRLAILTTTSLYGGGLNQYSRISIPSSVCGGENTDDRVRYKMLDVTEGQGSFHFSPETLNQIKILQARQHSRPRVNSIFGEGVSPKLRKVRNALEMAGFPSDAALTHGCPRAMYGVMLASNARPFLMGKEKRLKYILGKCKSNDATNSIADYWMSRWFLKRIAKSETLSKLLRHTLVHPVSHGARVVLPQLSEEEPSYEKQ